MHQFFQERGFDYVHTPLVTTSDAEGAGEMFQVTTLDLERIAESAGAVDYSKDFFGKPASLTVSGQLNVETYCQALGRVYTFGPTFRAENSNTTRHLSEFWMIEPEVAFNDIGDNMDLAEDFLKSLVEGRALGLRRGPRLLRPAHPERPRRHALQLDRRALRPPELHRRRKELEKKSGAFEFKPYWGCDLQSEHEKFLTEKVVGGPLIVTDYPKEIKAFYMKLNDDGRTVRAMDVLVPRFGEIIGGSEREERLDVLERRIGAGPGQVRLLVVSRPQALRHDAAFGFRPGLRAAPIVYYGHGEHSRRHTLSRAPKLADF